MTTCDLCGKEVDNDYGGSLNRVLDEYITDNIKELCKPCMENADEVITKCRVACQAIAADFRKKTLKEWFRVKFKEFAKK